MKGNKILLLASLAFAMVMLALPAGASALTITDGGKPIENDQSAKFSGIWQFKTLGTGLECTVDATITINYDTVEMTKFEFTNAPTCLTFGSHYEKCNLEEPEAVKVTNLPWVIDVTSASTLTQKGNTEGKPGVIDFKFETDPFFGMCTTTKNDLTLEDVTLDVETKEGFINGLLITGNIKIHTAAPGGGSPKTVASAVAGTLTIEESKAKTYTIG